jgi:hypothetical protein
MDWRCVTILLRTWDANPLKRCDITEKLDGERNQTRPSRIEVHVWELVENRCLQQVGSTVHTTPSTCRISTYVKININFRQQEGSLIKT